MDSDMHEGENESTRKQNNKSIFTRVKLRRMEENVLYFFVFFLLPLASFSSFYNDANHHHQLAESPQKKKNYTNLALSTLCIHFILALALCVFPTILRRPLLGRCFRLDGEESVEPPLLLTIQEFCKLIGAFAHAVLAKLSQNRPWARGEREVH